MDLRLQQDDELSKLVAGYVVQRDECGFDSESDFTEGGLTDFDYVGQDLTPAELIQVGLTLHETAGGRDIWYTDDGVGFRIFFGPIEEVRDRVRQKSQELHVVEVLES